jgi:hypothetical protein
VIEMCKAPCVWFETGFEDRLGRHKVAEAFTKSKG